MKTHNLSFICIFFAVALFGNVHAQNAGPTGIYEISSGAYVECCGIGGETRTALPNNAQRLIALNLDAESHTASLAILGDDVRTVFSIVPVCPPSQPVFFNFQHGLIFPDHFLFFVDPGPDGSYWHYSLDYSPSRLVLNGVFRKPQPECADAPDQFTHTNVVAYLVAPPNLELSGYFQDRSVITVHGRAGWLTVVEASSDLKTWVQIGREIMPATRCARCPMLDVVDTVAGVTSRFYRSYQRPE